MLPIHLNMDENNMRVMKSVVLFCLFIFLLCIGQTAPAELTDTSKKFETENVTIIMVSETLADEKARAAIAENKIIMLGFEDVHFDLNKSALTPDAKTILKRNIQLLKDNPDIQIRIAGYTSASGTQSHNKVLSEQRAKAVKDYLINEGLIKTARLSTIGYGEKGTANIETAPKEIYADSAKSNMRVLFEIVVKKGPVQK
jgi:outer membrane protein OmpA-like peptidoglycan-associated protein